MCLMSIMVTIFYQKKTFPKKKISFCNIPYNYCNSQPPRRRTKPNTTVVCKNILGKGKAFFLLSNTSNLMYGKKQFHYRIFYWPQSTGVLARLNGK